MSIRCNIQSLLRVLSAVNRVIKNNKQILDRNFFNTKKKEASVRVQPVNQLYLSPYIQHNNRSPVVVIVLAASVLRCVHLPLRSADNEKE